jgi:hypothetical protein
VPAEDVRRRPEHRTQNGEIETNLRDAGQRNGIRVKQHQDEPQHRQHDPAGGRMFSALPSAAIEPPHGKGDEADGDLQAFGRDVEIAGGRADVGVAQ